MLCSFAVDDDVNLTEATCWKMNQSDVSSWSFCFLCVGFFLMRLLSDCHDLSFVSLFRHFIFLFFILCRVSLPFFKKVRFNTRFTSHLYFFSFFFFRAPFSFFFISCDKIYLHSFLFKRRSCFVFRVSAPVFHILFQFLGFIIYFDSDFLFLSLLFLPFLVWLLC